MKRTVLSLLLMGLFAARGASQTDVSSLVKNPSFEVNGAEGWTVKGMSVQTNTYFSRKVGTHYLESWVSIGQQLGSVSALQTLSQLPGGVYRLTANALHIQQSRSNSTTNAGAAQTGAYLVAGSSTTLVTAMKTYTVDFAVVDEAEDVEIGIRLDEATGNWVCVDNFKLQRVGDVTVADYAGVVAALAERGRALLAGPIQQSAAEPLEAAVAAAQQALEGTGTDADGNREYDADALAAARQALLSALADAEASRSRYMALKERMDYGRTVLGWWQDVATKQAQWKLLSDAIATAETVMTDCEKTNQQLTQAVNTLNTRIKAVDKKIYCSGNAVGSDAELKRADSYWSYERSLQSKHWILFWEKGYGTDVPSAVPGILANADKIFELYANELGFITINKGRSKTDTYKMIIRLRHSTSWEANGSGIDNQIGMLTLSNGAHTSRSGQTVAHEIGHCFQYQTHCDNGNQNGWMYNWGTSTLNVFWEMCAQWQAYKYYPGMQFANEWVDRTLNGQHRHPLCPELRYHNFFIQDYFCHRHGMDFVGQLWNKSQRPEDPLQAYMRLTMSGTAAKKLEQLGDEMWEYGARMTTFDLDPIRDAGKNSIGKRNQTELKRDAEGYWWPTASNCIENWGNNAIRLNVPSGGKTVYVEFEGEAGAEGYTELNKKRAGWRLGFVALKKDGTRVYGDVAQANFTNPRQTVAFDCPTGCSYLWLVVSGAPTLYWTRDWKGWDSVESTAEQWPYRVKFHQTNVYGKTNNNTYPDAIIDIAAQPTPQPAADGIYTLDGRLVRRSQTELVGLPRGIYVVGGRKVAVGD